jgi:hypothetical protein
MMQGMKSDDARWKGINTAVVLAFFFEFSRFEYALKRAGFLIRNTRDAKPDWDVFAGAVAERWHTINDEQFASACAYLVQNPPAKQVVVDRALAWQDTTRGAGERDAAFVLRCVRQVRNNLFHGGKFPLRPIPSVERDARLLDAARSVLGAALTLDENVRSHFEDSSE